MTPSGPVSPAGVPGARKFRVGTLAYTRSGLLQVIFWMLWGDFFFQLLESLPSIIPLQLRWEGASDVLIGFNGSLASIAMFIMSPIAAVQSDRRRTWLGRRRPFLLWCTPPTVLSLMLFGLAKPGGAMLQSVLAKLGGAQFSAAGCTIAWILACTVMFQVFNTYIVQVYAAMVVDVIPSEVIGKFTGIYRAVGGLGSLVFNRWAMGYVEAHTFHVYALIGLLYTAAFYLIVWRVKEGDYPPPAPRAPNRRWGGVKSYCKECYTHPFYLNVYCLPFFTWCSLVPMGYMVFFATSAGQPGYAATLGLTLQEFGQLKSWTFLVQVVVYLAAGALVDRFHPLRIGILGLLLTSLSYFCCFWFIHDPASLLLWWCLNQAAIALFLVAYLSILPRVFPADKYGQFFSANSTIGLTTMVLSPPLFGWLLETIRDYSYIFVFSGTCTTLALVACVTLFLQWKKLGGDLAFTPPRTDCPVDQGGQARRS